MATKYATYADVRKIAEMPLAKRRMVPIGREGKAIKPRKFHLSDEEVTQLRAEFKETGRFPNPHNKGFYFYGVESLVDLGINEPHSLANVMRKIEALMSDKDTKDEDGKTAWQRFAKRDPRNAETGKDVDGRALQNFNVLQRLSGHTPYGMKLLEVGKRILGTAGAVIDITQGTTGTLFLSLNTKSGKPVNESKRQRKAVAVAPKAKPAKKSKPKTSKPKAPKAVQATEAPAPVTSETETASA